jgi:ribonuclease PH
MAATYNRKRPGGRANDALRPVEIEPGYAPFADGSALIKCGNTHVLCTATIEDRVPPFLAGKGRGWVTAEYGMLPRSSPQRISRENVLNSGRTKEIQRMIGRSLRAVVEMRPLGERTVLIDCDVLQADGGTRTAAITGGYLALRQALGKLVRTGQVKALPLKGFVAAVSVGLVYGELRLDLEYAEDSQADVDLNVVMSDQGLFLDMEFAAEGGKGIDQDQLDEMLGLAGKGIRELIQLQRAASDV